VTINAVFPSFAECRVVLVHADGTEEDLRNVERVHWDSGDGSGPTRAVLRMIGVEIDAEGEAAGL
jgi:hypothetical protein